MKVLSNIKLVQEIPTPVSSEVQQPRQAQNSALCTAQPLLTASAHNIQAGVQPLPALFPLLQREVAQATPVAPPPESPVVHDWVQPVKAASQPLPASTARPKARAQAPSSDRQKCAQEDIRVPPRRGSRVRATAAWATERPRSGPAHADRRARPGGGARRGPPPARSQRPREPARHPDPGCLWPPLPGVLPRAFCFTPPVGTRAAPASLPLLQERSTEGTRERGSELWCRYAMRARSE